MSPRADHPPPRAERPAEPPLLRGFLDDGALLAPGATSPDRAVGDHLASAADAYGELLGPLLVPADQVEALLAVKRSHPIAVALVAEPDTTLQTTRAALDLLEADPMLTVAGLSVDWADGWAEAGAWGPPLSVGIPLDERSQEAIEDVAGHSAAQSAVQALFTIGDAAGAEPTAHHVSTVHHRSNVHQLAAAIRGCVDLDLGYALRGGQPPAVTRTGAGDEPQVGLLNVLSASRYALAHAAEVPELVELLREQDTGRVLAVITRMSAADASVVRAFCTAYGCTGVREVVGELAELGLLTTPV